MHPAEELFAIAQRLENACVFPELSMMEEAFSALHSVVNKANLAFSGSWLGYHAYVYYEGLKPAPPGAHFSQEWGLQDLAFSDLGSRGAWREYNPEALQTHFQSVAGDPDISSAEKAAASAMEVFEVDTAEMLSIFLTENEGGGDVFLSQLLADLGKLQPLTAGQMAEIWSPKGHVITRDMVALNQGTKIPPHFLIQATVSSIEQTFSICREAARIGRKAASHMDRKLKRKVQDAGIGTNIFIGHGRSSAWRELKDFLQDRLHLPWDEFNRLPVAGVTNQARLSEMLDAAALALVIMTAEDETAEGEMQARLNVVHEVGLFQGRLGFTKAIVLFESGCQEFSNIQGLGQIRFPAGNIGSCFEEVRRVLEREEIIPQR